MRLSSWNIQWGRGADGKVDLQRTVNALKAIGDLDVICLQEVAQCFPGLAGGQGEDEVAMLCAAFPDYEAVFGAAVDVPDGAGGRARFGNMVLSRLPLGQVFRHLLPAPPDPSMPSMQRVCVEVVVNTPFGPLRVMTIHLEYYSAIQRHAQIMALRSLHAEAVGQAMAPSASKESNPSFRPWPRPVAAVLCGDFNCEPDSPDYQQLLLPMTEAGMNWVDAWRVLHRHAAHPPTVGLHGADWPDRPYCCDFFVVTDDLAGCVRDVRVIADTPASDHQPIVLELA